MRPLLITCLAACAPVAFDEVAPVVEARCLGCHAGSAGLALDDPSAWATWGAVARAAVADRTMAPWLPGDAGVPLQGALDLDRAEGRLLLDWLDEGAPHPEGATFSPPPRPTLDADLRLAWPDHDVAGEQDRRGPRAWA